MRTRDRRRGRLLILGAIVIVATLGIQLVATWLSEDAGPPAVNPFPALWPDWGHALSYVPRPLQWRELGPNAGAIDIVVPDNRLPGVVFAGGRFSGLYRSIDGGMTWERAGSGVKQYYVTSIVVDPWRNGTVYAVAGGYLHISRDEGSSWEQEDVCEGNSSAFLVDAQVPGVDYLTCGDHLMVSRNQGVTWSPSYPGIRLQSLVDIRESGDGLFLMGVDSNHTYVIMKSADGGNLWVSSYTGWNATEDSLRPSIAVDPDNASVVLANAPQGIMLTENGGANWTRVVADSYGVTGGFVAFDPYNSSIYAGRVLLYRSDDFGKTFQSIGTWNIDCITTPVPDYHADVGSLAFMNGGDKLLLGTDGGVDISLDAGATWACTPSGMMNGLAYDVEMDPFDPFHVVVTRQDYYPIQSYDGGGTWSTIYRIQSEWGSVRFDSGTRGVLYIASGGGVWKSTDAGRTFVIASKGLPTVPYPSSPKLELDHANPNTLWLSIGSLGLFKSVDSASSWSRIPEIQTVQEVDARGRVAYAVAAKDNLGSVWKTADGGGTWNKVNLPLNEQYYNVKIDPSNSSVVYVVGASLHVSRNGGTNFTTIHIPSDLVPSQLGSFGASPLILFAQRIGNLSRLVLASAKYGNHVNVYQSIDGGTNWLPVTGNLNSTMVTEITANPSYPIQLLIATFGEGALMENVEVPLTLNFTVDGPAAAFSIPRLTYVSGGETKTVQTGGTPATYEVDWGTSWFLQMPVPEVPNGGRWISNEPTAAVATLPVYLNVTYTYQALPEGR